MGSGAWLFARITKLMGQMGCIECREGTRNWKRNRCGWVWVWVPPPHKCMPTHTHARAHTHTHACAHAHARARAHTHHAHIHIYTYTHTHAHPPSLQASTPGSPHRGLGGATMGRVVASDCWIPLGGESHVALIAPLDPYTTHTRHATLTTQTGTPQTTTTQSAVHDMYTATH